MPLPRKTIQRRRSATATMLVLSLIGTTPSLAQTGPTTTGSDAQVLSQAAEAAQRQLHQTFTNLTFEEFGPAPIKGAIYQAFAGGRVIYYAPASGHIVFGTVYDRNGLNVTALAQEASARKRFKLIDPKKALAIGPVAAPTVIEFTDPDCPYCRALDRFWAAKAAEGKPVRRLIYFVSKIHPQSAAKAEHILCSKDQAAAFHAIYAGADPQTLLTCEEGKARVAEDAALVEAMGIGGTPTLIAGGKLISGFRQAELEAFLDGKQAGHSVESESGDNAAR
ncbi:DsbC family protein [Novosphingobium sp. KN65.2]|uniref:DsbC family protein n=1 Tax=Novosphingobium sp. KN65.2 TaxID=1478134 RepID=UPI0005E0E418|nr:DsbC family protein [Novosphingobium sp. KN65.2]CDO35959.1 Protein-disulfide isomerase [Novosphingobium sp. KN65.2]